MILLENKEQCVIPYFLGIMKAGSKKCLAFAVYVWELYNGPYFKSTVSYQSQEEFSVAQTSFSLTAESCMNQKARVLCHGLHPGALVSLNVISQDI